MTGTGAGQGVDGFVPDGTTPFDPVIDGYPTSNPTTGFTPKGEGFAGIIFGNPPGGGPPTLELYCFDLFTETWPGLGYTLGTWNAATVPNVGYVARILNEYYPFVPTEPTGLANTNQMAAAVQAAIWFFSDSFVLNTSDPLYATVTAIVAKIISEGPVTAPPTPSLSITPTNASGPSTSAVVGPFTVTSTTTGSAAVTATGANMFSDAAGTVPIPDGTVVPSGTQIWLRSTGTTSAILQATATADVPKQNVYLYDGNTNGVLDAQRLMLALDSTLTTTVAANAEFKEVGSLVVQKTIAGPAAGSQGQVTIHTVCDGTALNPDLVVASGSPAGTSSRTYTGIPAGSICTITETANGTEHTTNVEVDVAGGGQQVTIPTNSAATVSVTNTYTFVPGSLTVVKNITGAGAGQQGPVTITVSCPGVPASETPDFVIPAKTEGSSSMTYDNIPANTTCTVTETEDGHNNAVSVTVTPTGPQTVTVGVDDAATVAITNDYELNPGRLVVTKTIAAGGAAGHQGEVTIHVVCGGTALTPDFVIPAGTGAGTTTSPDTDYTGIPAGTECTATETSDGSTSTVAAAVTGDNGTPITIPAGDAAKAAITNTYTDSSGQLVVNKEITGNGAGQQGPVTIHVECPAGTPVTPDFTIPAGGASDSMTYSGLPSGTVCTVSETANGAIPGVVGVATTIVQPGPIESTGSVEATVTDDYTLLTGSLAVTKTIGGTAAGQQGPVTIHVFCPGVPASQTPPFTIPADTPTGSLPPQTYDGIPDGTKCIVFETADGRTSTVSVTVSPRVQTAPPIVAGSTVRAVITDVYTSRPGGIVVGKIIAGPFAGQQGPITIRVACAGVPASQTPDFTIPAGTPVGLRLHFYGNIQAGAACTVTETADGATSIVTATLLGKYTRSVTVASGRILPVLFLDNYTDSPGELVVTKTITGSGASHQGEIAILVDCGQTIDQFAFLIPASTGAGQVSRSFPDIPAGSTCTVTETSNGATSTVTAAAVGSGQKVTVDPNQTATAQLTDTFTTQATETAATTPTTEPAATLAATGASPATPRLIELGVVAIAAGGLLVALGGGRRYRARHSRPVKPPKR